MPTISDVARRAGVSTVTVSRVINAARNVNPGTRARVEQAVRELGYVPNVVARSLRSKRTQCLALIVPDITNSFWTTVARGVEDAAQSSDYSVLLCNTDENLVKQARYLQVVASQRVDGVIIAPYDSDARNLAELQQRSIPGVIVDRRVDGWDVDSVACDSVANARALVRHLLAQGHRQIAVVSGPLTTSTAEDRVAGYCLALQEAGLPVDSRLIRRGEFRANAGEQLTARLFAEGLNPTAIFASNNAIALGVMAGLARLGRRVPQDVTLVCVDDLPNAGRCFPFLTVVVQPAYDMGVNAAQLLLSRLDRGASLPARHVILPARMILRSPAGQGGVESQSGGEPEAILVRPLTASERSRLPGAPALHATPLSGPGRGDAGPALAGFGRSDANRLLKAFRHEEPDRIPYLEPCVTDRLLYEHVLERELGYDRVDLYAGAPVITPEDHVEFARRLAIDAVACNFSSLPVASSRGATPGRPASGAAGPWPDLAHLEPPTPLADQLTCLERYVAAAQGAGVGIGAGFASFFDSALLAMAAPEPQGGEEHTRPVPERLMDALLVRLAWMLQAVCDRFGDDLAFVLIGDDIADEAGLRLPLDVFREVFVPRMRRLITPARERGKLVLLRSAGRLGQALPALHEIGFDAVYFDQPELNDMGALKLAWAGKLAFAGSISSTLLVHGTPGQIGEQVAADCLALGPGGGFALGTSGRVTLGIPPENFLAMTRAVHRYGRYGALGRDG